MKSRGKENRALIGRKGGKEGKSRKKEGCALKIETKKELVPVHGKKRRSKKEGKGRAIT